MRLWRAADSDIITDTASFSESREAADAYLNNPGYGGDTLYFADVVIDDAATVLDLVDCDGDPVDVIASVIDHPHPGAIGADEYAPRVSADLLAAGYEWVRVTESYPADSVTWIWLGGENEPELEEVEP